MKRAEKDQRRSYGNVRKQLNEMLTWVVKSKTKGSVETIKEISVFIPLKSVHLNRVLHPPEKTLLNNTTKRWVKIQNVDVNVSQQ